MDNGRVGSMWRHCIIPINRYARTSRSRLYQRVTFYLRPDAKSQWVELTLFFFYLYDEVTAREKKNKKKVMKEKSIIAKKKKNISFFAIVVF